VTKSLGDGFLTDFPSLKSFQSVLDNNSLGKSSPWLRLLSIVALSLIYGKRQMDIMSILIKLNSLMLLDEFPMKQTILAHFVGQVSNQGNGFAGQTEMDLGGIKVLGA
jgi:hypothetical protein